MQFCLHALELKGGLVFVMESFPLLFYGLSVTMAQRRTAPATRTIHFQWTNLVIVVGCSVISAVIVAFIVGTWGIYSENIDHRVLAKLKGSQEFGDISKDLKAIKESVGNIRVEQGKTDERLKGLERQVFADKLKTAGIKSETAQINYVAAQQSATFNTKQEYGDIIIDIAYFIKEISGKGILIVPNRTYIKTEN